MKLINFNIDTGYMGIYLLTNTINGKQYVGQAYDLKTRIVHYQNLRSSVKGQIRLYRAFLKYGLENFTIQILWQTSNQICKLFAKKVLNEKEIYFIEQYQTFELGYNMTKGGGGILGLKYSEESRKKISKKNKGKTLSEETRKKISKKNKGKTLSEETRKKMSENNTRPNLGKTPSEETRKKMSEKKKGKKPWLGKTHSEETRKKISEKHKGKKLSQEHIQKRTQSRQAQRIARYEAKKQYLKERLEKLGNLPKSNISVIGQKNLF